jgi:hypothetical protein
VEVALAFTHQLGTLSNVTNNNNPESDPAYRASIKIISEVTEEKDTVEIYLNLLKSILGSENPIDYLLNNNSSSINNRSYILMDAPIAGVTYICKKPNIPQKTDAQGVFTCDEGPVTFKIGGLVLGEVSNLNHGVIFPQDLLGLPRNDITDPKLIALLRLLQSLDNDGDISVSINITDEISEKFQSIDEEFDLVHLNMYAQIAGEAVIPITLISEEDAIRNFIDYMKSYFENVSYNLVSHNLDGQTLYWTACTYHLGETKEEDEIEGIASSVNFTGSQGILEISFNNGYIDQILIPGMNLGAGSLGINYYKDNDMFLFDTTGTSEYSALLAINNNYYITEGTYIIDGAQEINAFFTSLEDAETYIQKVYSKEQRTCLIH